MIAAPPTLDDFDIYRAQLKAIGLECNDADTCSHLQEGLYPVEISQKVADAIFSERFNLLSLLASPGRSFKLRYMKFFFIAANSD